MALLLVSAQVQILRNQRTKKKKIFEKLQIHLIRKIEESDEIHPSLRDCHSLYDLAIARCSSDWL